MTSASNVQTFDLPPPNTSTSVSIPSHTNLTLSELLSFPAFKTWLSTISHSLSLQRIRPSHPFASSPYSIRSIKIQSIDRFGGKRLGFVKLTADVSNDNGESLPGSIFLRGGAVAMLVVLRVRGTEEKYVVMTKQARIPAGSLDMSEIPAGMIDDSGNFAGKAAEEIQEELGVEIPAEELIDMTALASQKSRQVVGEDNGEQLQEAVYTSGGGSDEFISIFYHEKEVERENLEEWKGKLTGLRERGEKITLKLVRWEDLWWEGRADVKALSAVALFEGLTREGRM